MPKQLTKMEQITNIINSVRLSKKRDSPLKYNKILKSSMREIETIVESDGLNEEQVTFLLNLFEAYKKESTESLQDFMYSVALKAFFFTLSLSLLYLFFIKGMR